MILAERAHNVDVDDDCLSFGTLLLPDGAVCWRVWAPRAESVQLVLFEDRGRRRTIAMQSGSQGDFLHVEHNVQEGQRYAYRLDGGPERPDPVSRWQPDGVHRPSAVFFPQSFDWPNENWTGMRREDLVIYELHVGTFTPEGTFAAIMPRLTALRELGITAIELMPVAQFPGERDWGYDGVHPFAVQNSYGGPRELQRLVNVCHLLGMAVILDVVYNHLGPEGNYLSEFGPYFTDHYHTPWGSALNTDDVDCEAVREFVLDNVRQWIRDFHVDGLRLDAVQEIRDNSPRHILADIHQVAAEEAERIGWPVQIIAESNLNDVRLVDSQERSGYGLDAQWSDDFHHCVHALLTGEHDGYYADYGQPEQLVKALNQTFVYDGCHSVYRGRAHGAPTRGHSGDRFVVSIQNHDQVGNRALGDRFGTLLSPAQQRLAAGLLLLAPDIPLLFMGEEYGETRPFPFFCSFEDPQLVEATREGRRAEFASFEWADEVPDPQDERTFQSAKLSWLWRDGSWHAGLRCLYHDLLEARHSWPPLHDFRNRFADLISQSNILHLVRGGQVDGPETVVAYFNLSPHEDSLRTSPPGVMLLTSESPEYGGHGLSETSELTLRPYEFRVYGPAEFLAPHHLTVSRSLMVEDIDDILDVGVRPAIERSLVEAG